MAENFITINIELPENEAYALAQLAKRISFMDARENAVDDVEAYAMVYGMSRVRDGLEDAGVYVR